MRPERELQKMLFTISEGQRVSDELSAMMQGLPPNDIYQIGYSQCYNQVWAAFKTVFCADRERIDMRINEKEAYKAYADSLRDDLKRHRPDEDGSEVIAEGCDCYEVHENVGGVDGCQCECHNPTT